MCLGGAVHFEDDPVSDEVQDIVDGGYRHQEETDKDPSVVYYGMLQAFDAHKQPKAQQGRR